MDVELVRSYCMQKTGVTESFPFNDTALVFKVADKMFALLNLEYPQSINLKCDPAKALELREEFEEIKPGYHMNKKHWNALELSGTLSNKLIEELINLSYELVVEKLPRFQKDAIANFQ